MAKLGYNLIATAAVALLGVAFAQDAQAQQHRNPNLGHFYMARQQIQITDDSPIIRYKGNGGQAGQPAVQAPNRPQPLPKAGFQRFSHQLPSYSTGLPQVNNGVPRPVPQRRSPAKRTGKGAKAGKWKAPKKRKLLKKKKPTVQRMKSYSPYKGYDPKTAKKQTHHRAAHSVSGHKTKTKVRGSILHWARGQR